jgi:hypothetical protein
LSAAYVHCTNCPVGAACRPRVDLEAYQTRKKVGKNGIRVQKEYASMIQLFEIDDPTSIVEVPPATPARMVDLMAYLTENKVQYIGELTQVQHVPLTEAMAVGTGHEPSDTDVTILMRARTQKEVNRAKAAH